MAPSGTADVSRLDEAIDQIEALGDARRRAEAQQVTAEEQFLSEASSLYRAGSIGLVDLVALAHAYRDVSMPGFSTRWNSAMPIKWAQIMNMAERGGLPNGPDDSWVGEGRPFGDESCPPTGVSVIYTLYDQDWNPVYVGSTERFRLRIKTHYEDSDKPFTYWRAWRCRDRADAYRHEAEILDGWMPPLNRRLEGRGR